VLQMCGRICLCPYQCFYSILFVLRQVISCLPIYSGPTDLGRKNDLWFGIDTAANRQPGWMLLSRPNDTCTICFHYLVKFVVSKVSSP
jgi:hypothetical protein